MPRISRQRILDDLADAKEQMQRWHGACPEKIEQRQEEFDADREDYAKAMRRVSIPFAAIRWHDKLTSKRGGDFERQPLEAVAAPQPDQQLLDLDEALQRFAQQDPIKAQLVELRYFVGMTADEAAEVLGISPTTADRYWAYARAWLQAEVRGR